MIVRSMAPLGCQMTRPAPTSSLSWKRSSSLPSLRWSRLLGLLQAPQIFIELLLRRKGGAVDALEHLVALVPAPVGAGH